MLELSPTSTQCAHGAAVKLFCRYVIVVCIEQSLDHRYIVALGMGVTPSVLQVNSRFLDRATMSMDISGAE
jgi:hypothetical protein